MHHQLSRTDPKENRTGIGAESEYERIHSLIGLSGVSWYTASVILHFTFEGQYPTLSRRALWSWGYEEKPSINFEFWRAYVEVCRALVAECAVTMRDLDRALWQFATEYRDEGDPS